MRRINWKFAAVLIVVLVLSGLGAWGLYVVQSGRIAQSLLWQARKDHEDGHFESANKLAAQYLQFRPDDTAVLLELADWMRSGAVGRRQLASALQLYEKILRFQTDNGEVRRKAVEVYLALGQYGEALDHLERLLQIQPNDAALLTQAGRCLHATGKLDAANDFYRRAMRADARYIAAYVYAAGLQQSQFKNPVAAGVLLERAVAANPESADARAALGGHLRRQRKFDDAARCVKQGLDREPNNPTLLMAASEIASAAGDFAQSRALLDRGCQAHPKDTRFVCALAWQLLYDGRADLAAEKLRAGNATNPNDIDVLTLLADVLAQDGQTEPLEKALRDLRELKAPPEKIAPRVQYVEARLLMVRGRFPDALQKLNNLRQIAQRMPSLHRQVNALLAQCCGELGDHAGEVDAIKRLLESDPNAGAMRLEYARALAGANLHSDALREFLVVIPRSEISSRLIASTARVLIDRARTDPDAWTNLQRAIENLTLDDANANPTIARAELDRIRNRPEVALTQIVKNLSKLPHNATLHAERAALFELKFGADRALAALAEGEQLAGDQADLRLLKARLLSGRIDRSQIAILTGLSENVEQFRAEDRVAILRAIIAGCRFVDDSAAVNQMLYRLSQVCPDDFASREALYSMAVRSRNIVLREVLRQEIESLEGKDGPCLQRVEAERFISGGAAENLKQAETLLEKCAAKRPADPAIPFLRGRIAEIRGQVAAARDQYSKAWSRGFFDRPNEELLLSARGSAGTQPCAILVESIAARVTVETSRSLVIAALPLFDTDNRMRFAERLLAQCPADHAPNQAWLGQLFARMGLPEQSEAAFRRAAAAAPQARDGWLSLLTERMSDSVRFAATVVEVQQALPPLEAALVIGRAYEIAKRPDDARREFEKAAQLNAEDSRPLRLLAGLAMHSGRQAEACKVLESLVRSAEDKSPEDVRWARRTLALQLAFQPSLANFQRAMALLDQNKVGESWVVDDMRARALVLATQKSRPIGDGKSTARREAIAILETLQQRNTARNADDLLLLAKLLRAENDSDRFQRVLDRMRIEYRGHFATVAFLAREALRESDAAGCEKLLPVLKQLGPGQLETVAIEFHLRILSDDFAAADRLLTDYCKHATDRTDEARRNRQLADFLFGFLAACPVPDRPALVANLQKAALSHHMAAFGFRDDGMQRLVTLLAQSGQSARALELLQGQWADRAPELITAAQILVLRHGFVSESQHKSFEQYLVGQVEKHPNSVPLRINLADYYQFTKSNDRAVTLYRQVLATEPNNVAALNNLAWTLAGDRTKAPEALALVQRAIDLIGPMDDLLDTRARIRFESGDVQAGLRDLTEAVTEAPTATRLADLAAMHRKAGQPDMALRFELRIRKFSGEESEPHNRETQAKGQKSAVRNQE
jgi:cellulose synthase operon protein C